METGISNLHEEATNKINKFDVTLNELNNNINKKKLDVANNQYSNLLLEYNQSNNSLMEIKDELNKNKDKLNKTKDKLD